MSGMYWGLTAMALLGRLEEMDTAAVAEWVLSAQKEGGGFGASPRNDAHLLYTLSAVQVGGRGGVRGRSCVEHAHARTEMHAHVVRTCASTHMLPCTHARLFGGSVLFTTGAARAAAT